MGIDLDPSKKAPDPVDVHVGRRLRLRREILRLSQEQVANGIGVTFQQIQKYEQGRNRISASRLFDVSQVLGISISYLFQGMPGEESASTSKQRRTAAAESPGMMEEPKGDIFSDANVLDRTETLELVRSFWRIPNAKARAELLGLIELLGTGESEK